MLITACNGDVYLRDGVTDGDTFFLSTRAMTVDDPATQSWVSYSLTRSACQLQSDIPNPARAGSLECELVARQHLLETWHEQRQQNPDIAGDEYLEELQRVAAAGYLAEYVAYYFDGYDWHSPVSLDRDGFQRWRKAQLRGHKPRTRLTGSWGYSSKSLHD